MKVCAIHTIHLMVCTQTSFKFHDSHPLLLMVVLDNTEQTIMYPNQKKIKN